MYAISTAAMLQKFDKLSLEKGDVIVVRDPECLDYLSRVKMPIDFLVPLIFAPSGIDKLTRQDLLNLLEQLEQNHTESSESLHAPL